MNPHEVIEGLRAYLHEIAETQHVDIDYLRKLTGRFSLIEREYYEVLTEIETAARKVSSGQELKKIYPVITEALGRDGLGHGVMFRAKRRGASLEGTASFRASVSMMARRRQLNRHFGPETFVTDKMRGEDFARTIGLETALAHDKVFTAENVPIEAGTVIKPRSELGSKGVFIIGYDGTIFDVQMSEHRESISELRKILCALASRHDNVELVRGRGRVVRDEWIVERAIFDNYEPELPARDVKFFVFYGKIAAVLEIMRFPDKRYAWWDAYGNRVKTGIYDESDWEGAGVSREEIEMASRVSSKIPGAFLRIDFLRSRDGLIFGEFSGGAGDYDKFNREWDRKLGDMFLEAEGRLTADLLTGREFVDYQDMLNSYYRHYRHISQERFMVEGSTDLVEVSEKIATYCQENRIRGFVSRSASGELELVVRTGERAIGRLESHLNQLTAQGYIGKFRHEPYFEAFSGQLLFQNYAC